MFHPDLDTVTSCLSLNQRNVTVKPLPAMISEASPSVQLYQKFLNTASLRNMNPFSLHLTASLRLRKDVDVASPFVQLDLLLMSSSSRSQRPPSRRCTTMSTVHGRQHGDLWRRAVIDNMIKSGNTANICAVDVSK